MSDSLPALPPRDFVFYLSSEWDRFHRPGMIRAMARAAAARGGKVLIINNPVCPVTAPLNRRERWLRWIKNPGSLVRLEDNLFLYDAYIMLHDKLSSAIPGMRAINRWVLQRQIRKVLNALAMSPDQLVSWFHFPTFQHYVGMLNESMAVYECYDEHTAIPNLRASTRKRNYALEQQLFQKVDVVFTTSIPLLEAKSPFHSRIFCSHNAADTEFFSRVQRSDAAVSTQCPLSGKPVVGYLGTIHEHTDLALLRQAAEARPGWGFLLIGTIQKGTDSAELQRLKSLSNVYMPGWVEGAEFIALLKLFDVAVIPYKADSDFNRFVNPNKVHEYTAMGKPVVATRVCDLSTHGEFVTLVDDLEGFLAGIAAAYSTDSPEKIQARLHSAAMNNWDARAADIFKHLATVRAEMTCG